MSPISGQALRALIAAWGYGAIAGVVLLGNMGLPVPEESILLIAGYLAWRGRLSLPVVIAVGVLSAIVGDNLGYWLGHHGGRPLLLRYGRYVRVSDQTLQRAEQVVARYGHWAVFWGRFIAGLRFLAGPLAGIAQMPFRRFFLANAGGAVVFVPVITWVGYRAGRSLHAVLGTVEQVERVVLFGVALLLVGLAWRYWGRTKG